MGESYFNLKQKLEELGYSNTLPTDAVPLVECILADLLQTTRSLQHYMNLSKEALTQRDSLLMEAEPYKCDNARLIQENNSLHKENINLKEENFRLSKESKRKIKTLSDELAKKETTVSKLQHEVRDLSLRGLCAGTLSSRNKSKQKDTGEDSLKICICNNEKNGDIMELKNTIQCLEEKTTAYQDEIMLLKSQVDHRDKEIIRLSILLEGGRPLHKDYCADNQVQALMNQIHDLESSNDYLKKEMENGLEKQHEAMMHALNLADKNKILQEELKKVDAVALKLEEDCNKRLSGLVSEINYLKSRLETMTMKNLQLEKEITQSKMTNTYSPTSINDSTAKEKEILQNEIKDLLDLNKSLQDKVISLSQENKEYLSSKLKERYSKDCNKYPTKDDLQDIVKSERIMYEKHLINIQEKLTETVKIFNDHLSKCKNNNNIKCSHVSNDSGFVKDLHAKLCESEQKILMLKKENDDLKSKIIIEDNNSNRHWKDIINQLNVENSELSRENISLSQQLSHYKNISHNRISERYNNILKNENEKLFEDLEIVKRESDTLKRDKQEYKLRHKESVHLIEKLKGDLNIKQSQIEQLQEENNSYKMTQRTGKASAEHLKEECNFLKEQISKMQSDVIREKTMANQIKNIQQETERSSNEMQGELLFLQKKISICKDTIASLEKKSRELQAEILSVNEEKFNLKESLKKVDQERDKLVIELDNKAETISLLEQKLKCQTFDIRKYEDEIADLKRKLTIIKVSEHKLVDSEVQMKFLNGEIARWKQQYDNALMENKHLQNRLADANGTLKITKIEYEKAKKEIDELKQQLQHYVTEVKRIEDMLSQKEAERSDMLEHFASLSVEANILENTNHSLESESASKSLQLQNHLMKIQDLESKLMDKDNIIDKQSTRIVELTSKITGLENEVRLISEEKVILEQNVAHLKQMCSTLQSDQKELCGTDSELKLYENRIKSLTNMRTKLEEEKSHLKESLATTERLLSNARKEIIELKLAFQDATSETKSLKEQLGRMSRIETEMHERTLTKEELELPLMLEETIHEVSNEEDDDSSRYREVKKRFSKYSHGGTW